MNKGSGRAECDSKGYGGRQAGVYRMAVPEAKLLASALFAALFIALFSVPGAHAAPPTILAFGDSLFAGLGVAVPDSLPAQLEAALKAAGHDVKLVNAAVSGDTTADGVARLNWSLASKPDLVLLELGSNDALRGLDPAFTRANLEKILDGLKAAHVPVVLIGMLAPRNLGPDFAKKFDPIYPELAAKYGVPLYPFVLDGVALDPTLTQADGMHPNPQGVGVMVKRMLPVVEKALPTAAPGPA